MSLFLGLDTSSDTGSFAFYRPDEGTLSHQTLERGVACERLLPAIEQSLLKENLCIEDITALAVCVGPGSFTGIRTAVAAVHGISFGHSFPVYGVSSLEAALPLDIEGRCLSYRSAIHSEVFVQTFEIESNPPGRQIHPVREATSMPISAIDSLHEQDTIPSERRYDFDSCPEACQGVRFARLAQAIFTKRLIFSGGSPLEPRYIKAVNAKTIQERLGA